MLELILGGLAAVGSISAVIVKTLSRRSEKVEPATITVQVGSDRYEKHGVIKADQVARVLDMVRDESELRSAAR
jgi:hypothetical protein